MPLDASEKFHTYIIGGILGDSEPQQRTRQLLTEKLGLPYRNLGPAQLTTDTAVLAVKKVLAGTPVDKLEFRNGIAIEVAGETVILPNSYLVEDDKPILTPGISDLLKRQKGMSFA
jgi:ribosome biogenesis SPOUT family RNA methylase Rps3